MLTIKEQVTAFAGRLLSLLLLRVYCFGACGVAGVAAAILVLFSRLRRAWAPWSCLFGIGRVFIVWEYCV
jgi:hypothetical protein